MKKSKVWIIRICIFLPIVCACAVGAYWFFGGFDPQAVTPQEYEALTQQPEFDTAPDVMTPPAADTTEPQTPEQTPSGSGSGSSGGTGGSGSSGGTGGEGGSGSAGGDEQPAVTVGYKTGNKSPDFSAATLSGTTFNLAANSGKVVVIDFWATWCSPCVNHGLPTMQQLRNAYGSDVVIIALSIDDSNDEIAAFASQNSYSFLIGSTAQYSLYSRYGDGYIPYTVIIGKDGVIVYSASGTASYSALASVIDAAR